MYVCMCICIYIYICMYNVTPAWGAPPGVQFHAMHVGHTICASASSCWNPCFVSTRLFQKFALATMVIAIVIVI